MSCLFDTNIFLEILLDQEKKNEARKSYLRALISCIFLISPSTP
jgi:hypothetical protein